MFPDKSARAAYEDARRAKERLGLGKGRRRSSYDSPRERLSFVCTASIVRRCLPTRVRISCLPQVTSRPPMHDSNLTIDRFSLWPRERDTIEFEATLEHSVWRHSSLSPSFGRSLSLSLSPFETSLLENA